MTIPDETVTAALDVLWANEDKSWMEAMRLALEAAALVMTTRAYNAGHLDGINGSPNNNPYGAAK